MSKPQIHWKIDKWMAAAHEAAFLLDFDGTMVYLADQPDKVLVPETLVQNLKKITRNADLSFAIVTGRALHSLDALMAGMTSIAVGSHGAEYRPGPMAKIEIIAPPMSPVVRQSLEMVAARHNCNFEDKIYTISMHLPLEHTDTDLMPDILSQLGVHDDFIVRKIGRTYEVLQKNINKGFGITHLMQQPQFKGKTPIYIGDDVGIDSSLDILDKLGGIRLAVDNGIIKVAPIDDGYLGIDNVNFIVQHLADYTILKTA